VTDACTQPAPRRAVLIGGHLVLSEDQDPELVAAHCTHHGGLHHAIVTRCQLGMVEYCVMRAATIVCVRCPYRDVVLVHVGHAAFDALVNVVRAYNPDPAYLGEVEALAAARYREIALGSES
jgi:hypothetical protein